MSFPLRVMLTRTATAVLLLAAVLGAGAPARAQVADHLKCYKMKDQLKLAGLADLNTPQFGADPGCKISGAKWFCVPASKTNVTATDKTTGLPITPLPVTGSNPGDRLCYKVKCLAPAPQLQEVTDQFGTRNLQGVGRVQQFKADFLCTPAYKGAARFVDNGDGTVTDNQTGLQWEQKTDDGSVRDKDNTYTWSASGTKPDGTAFTDFLGTLNNCVDDGTPPTGVTGGFAGHCDWRLPSIVELQTILAPVPCFPCIDPIFGPTANISWSSIAAASDPSRAWAVYSEGELDLLTQGPKSADIGVRAVRGGS